MAQQEIPTTTLQKFRVEWKQQYSWLAWTITMWKFLWFCETHCMVVYRSFLLCYWSMDQFLNSTLGQIINKVAIKPTMPQHPRDCPFSNSKNNNKNNNNIFIFFIFCSAVGYSVQLFKMAAEGDAERKEKHPPCSVSI